MYNFNGMNVQGNTQFPYTVPNPNLQFTQSGPQLIKVNGLDSARAYQTQPNSQVALFDANDDVMYIKTTDASNFPTIKVFRFYEEETHENKQNLSSYVTTDEFNSFKEEILNAQQSIREQLAAASASNANSSGNNSNKKHS